MSSIYETPVSSPTYATPMEGTSPWASPRTSLRSENSSEPPNITNTTAITSSSTLLPNNQNTNYPIDGDTSTNTTSVSNPPPAPLRGSTIQNSKPFTG